MEGFLRLFFVFISFLLNHVGWAILILLVLWAVFFIFGKFGLGVLQSAAVLLVVFLLFFLVAAWYADVPFCAFAEQASQLLA